VLEVAEKCLVGDGDGDSDSDSDSDSYGDAGPKKRGSTDGGEKKAGEAEERKRVQFRLQNKES
jgi:hypothetical protein